MVLVVVALLWGFLFSSRATGTRLRPNWWLDLHNWLGGSGARVHRPARRHGLARRRCRNRPGPGLRAADRTRQRLVDHLGRHRDVRDRGRRVHRRGPGAGRTVGGGAWYTSPRSPPSCSCSSMRCRSAVMRPSAGSRPPSSSPPASAPTGSAFGSRHCGERPEALAAAGEIHRSHSAPTHAPPMSHRLNGVHGIRSALPGQRRRLGSTPRPVVSPPSGTRPARRAPPAPGRPPLLHRCSRPVAARRCRLPRQEPPRGRPRSAGATPPATPAPRPWR